MKKCSIPMEGLDEKLIQQLKYAVFFIDETINDVTEADGFLEIEHQGDSAAIQNKAERLIERFSSHEFAYKERVLFDSPVSVPYSGNIVDELGHKRIIKLLENGIFTFRQPFTTLLRFFDRCFVSKIGNPLKAEEEYYPVIIHGNTLNKTNHFTSFPEHIHFVSHLKEDLDILDSFSQSMREQGGWKQEHPIDMNSSMQSPSYVINPATCYHCYEGMQEEQLEEGKVITAVSKVHRYEGKNHRDFGRLMDFTMREIIFVGTPVFVKEKREASLQMLTDILREWELDCYIENANDPFFTNDYKIKASFQRTQEMKYEVRMRVPYLGSSLAVASSNFHSNTFGKAFHITAGVRPALTGCLAFGLERWVFAFLSQYGLDEKQWPIRLREEWQKWREDNG